MKLNVTTYEQSGAPGEPSHDRLLVSQSEAGTLCLVSDGVGSGRDPGRCAERVVRLVANNFDARPTQWTIRKAFDRIVDQANLSLYQEGAYLDGNASMQATLTAVCFRSNRLHGLNVGDSPAFLIRDGIIQKLNEDHVHKNNGREVLTQAVGMGPNIRPFFFEKELQKGDRILVTSDGLTKLLNEEEIGKVASQSLHARDLMQQALRQNNNTPLDDLSAVLVKVDELGPELDQQPLNAFPFPQPAKGRQFDGYKLLHTIGGNGRVWLGEKSGKRCVIKFVPQEAETDDSGAVITRFSNEVWNACRLKDDFFVPSFRPDDGSPFYYIMDYVEAPSLRLFLKSRKFSVDEAVELGIFLCRAGQNLLRNELIHGDVKPENLLTSRTGDAISFKLLDLGLACPVFTDAPGSGTPTYMAPERFSGASVTERTEIFSIGATLYEMLTGKPPFGPFERFQKPSFSPAQRPSRLNANVPPWLDSVILKCLAIRQSNRFQCYSELQFVLEHPDKAPLNLLSEGPLLESNPLLFYKAGFWLLLAFSLLLIVYILCHH